MVWLNWQIPRERKNGPTDETLLSPAKASLQGSVLGGCLLKLLTSLRTSSASQAYRKLEANQRESRVQLLKSLNWLILGSTALAGI